MKKLLLLLFITTICYGQSWNKILTNSMHEVNDIFFIDENNGWVVGRSEISITEDGGETWTQLEYTPEKSLSKVMFFNSDTGIVAGSSGQFIVTTNGGTDWNEVNCDSTSGTINDFYFKNINEGWIATSRGELFYTIDGGTNWTLQIEAEDDLESVSFFNDNGIVCGKGISIIYYSEDGGQSWNKSEVPSLGSYNYTRTDLYQCKLISESNGHIVGWGSLAVGEQPSIHLKTSDGGKTWTYMDQAENSTFVTLYDLSFSDDNTAYSIGGDIFLGAVIVKTIDGGETWEKLNTPFGVRLTDVFALGENVWACGGSGVILKSEDSGNSWELMTKVPSLNLYKIQSVDENFVIAGGFNGVLLTSENGGEDWSSSYAYSDGKCPTIRDIHFINRDVGFLARYNRVVSKTTDGGNSWTNILKDTSDYGFTIYGVHFIDEDYGFAAGEYDNEDVIYKTTDGGENWDIKAQIYGEEFRDIAFGNKNNGAAVGRDMLLIHTDDSGESWDVPEIYDVPTDKIGNNLYSVKFYDENLGLAVGRKLILKTTDGGASWYYVDIEDLSASLDDICFISEDKWVTLGSKSIYHSITAGEDWNDVSDEEVFERSLNSISVTENGDLLAVSSNSTIYKLDQITGIEDEYNPVLVNFKLKQNYPNPFNPETNIEFSIPKNGYVELKVYNSIGEEITTLLANQVNSGKHRISFDGSQLSSGVYFYMLKYEDRSITRRMILMK